MGRADLPTDSAHTSHPQLTGASNFGFSRSGPYPAFDPDLLALRTNSPQAGAKRFQNALAKLMRLF